MSSPAEYYAALPPVTKLYGTVCFACTVACQLGILTPYFFAYLPQLVFYNFEVYKVVTTLFFLGKFSINFGIRLLMVARYGVQLESGPFQGRTADFLWMMIFGSFMLLVLAAIPPLQSPFLGVSLVFMLLYVWSREFPNASINIYGLVNIKAFYLPWAMLCLDVIFGSPIMQDLLGIIAGHLYYFLTVLHPLAGGRNILNTPQWVHKIVRRFRYFKPAQASAQPERTDSVFRGKPYRLNRVWVKKGAMIVLPAGIYHCFTLDSDNYIKAMRLFVGEPIWTPYNRPHDDHPARKGYLETFGKTGDAGQAVDAAA